MRAPIAKLGFVLLLAYNLYGLYFAGLFNAAGSGNMHAAWTVWIIGACWVFGFTFAAWKMCARGQNAKGLLIAFLPWPLASVVGMAVVLGRLAVSNFVSDREPLVPEFELACKSAGARYLAKPGTPVRSIAYDWEGRGPRETNTFELAKSGRIKSESFQRAPLPASIKFIEERCCANRGSPSTGEGPYIRQPNSSDVNYFGVKELTADALVTYAISTSTAGAQLTQVSLTVSDRRDGRTLATLQYVSDATNKKMCGATSEGTIDEAAFLRKAIGLD
jgi:hypothetical protein